MDSDDRDTLICDMTEAMLRAALVYGGKQVWQRKKGAVCLQRHCPCEIKIKKRFKRHAHSYL